MFIFVVHYLQMLSLLWTSFQLPDVVVTTSRKMFDMKPFHSEKQAETFQDVALLSKVNL